MTMQAIRREIKLTTLATTVYHANDCQSEYFITPTNWNADLYHTWSQNKVRTVERELQ